MAGNQIVPYCDSVVLNKCVNDRHYCFANNSNRDSTNNSNGNRFVNECSKQRYGGDYRFALSTGDIV